MMAIGSGAVGAPGGAVASVTRSASSRRSSASERDERAAPNLVACRARRGRSGQTGIRAVPRAAPHAVPRAAPPAAPPAAADRTAAGARRRATHRGAQPVETLRPDPPPLPVEGHVDMVAGTKAHELAALEQGSELGGQECA